MDIPQAAIYLRQSLKADEGIARQRERCSQIVSARGWDLAAEFEDNDVSASKPRGAGTAWSNMLDALGAGTVTHVVAVDLDRLLRTTRDLNTLIDAGARVVTVDGEIDLSTADGEFRATMLAGIARFEARRKGERQSRANSARADQGILFKGGVRLTGYTHDGEIIEDEADLVRWIFARFLQGGTLKGLARELTISGPPPRRAPRARYRTKDGEKEPLPPREDHVWPPSSVRSILANSRYVNRYALGGVPTGRAGTWAPIVDDPTFDAVQARLSDPRRNTRGAIGTARRHLGSGLYTCGTCHAPMNTAGTRYACPRGHIHRTREPIDEFVIESIRQWLERPNALSAFAVTDTVEADRIDAEAHALRLEMYATDLSHDTLQLPEARWRAKTSFIQGELARLERERAKLVGGGAAVKALGANRGATFVAADAEVKREVVRDIAEVELYKAVRGSRVFDPATVGLTWRAKAPELDTP
jgi:site-specific DNA recombinase